MSISLILLRKDEAEAKEMGRWDAGMKEETLFTEVAVQPSALRWGSLSELGIAYSKKLPATASSTFDLEDTS